LKHNNRKTRFQESSRQDSPLWIESCPELQALDRLHLAVVRAVKVPLGSPDMGMTHERLDRLQIIPIVQEGRCKRMPHHVGMNPLLDQGLFYHGSDEAVNSFVGQAPFLVGTMFAQRLEEGMVWICPVPARLQVILDGDEGPGVQRDAPELLPLADHVDDCLVTVEFEILDLEELEAGKTGCSRYPEKDRQGISWGISRS